MGAVTVCWRPSRFTHVTVVPTGTVNIGGEYSVDPIPTRATSSAGAWTVTMSPRAAASTEGLPEARLVARMTTATADVALWTHLLGVARCRAARPHPSEPAAPCVAPRRRSQPGAGDGCGRERMSCPGVAKGEWLEPLCQQMRRDDLKLDRLHHGRSRASRSAASGFEKTGCAVGTMKSRPGARARAAFRRQLQDYVR